MNRPDADPPAAPKETKITFDGAKKSRRPLRPAGHNGVEEIFSGLPQNLWVKPSSIAA